MEKLDSKGLTEEAFLAQYNSDKYPKPSLTADIIVFRKNTKTEGTDLLLIRRKGHPFIGCWALPGGFANKDETIERTAARELEEETGVSDIAMELVGVYSRQGRDPRGWTVSAAYMTVVNENEIKPEAGDDAEEVCWAKIKMAENCPDVIIDGRIINDELAFDHYDIVSDAMKLFKRKEF